MKLNYGNEAVKFLAVILLVMFAHANLYAGDSVTTGKKPTVVLPAGYFSGVKVNGTSVAKVIATDKVLAVKFKDPYILDKIDYVYAGTFTGTVDNNPAKFFCVDIAHSLKFYTAGDPHTYTDSNATPSKITYILMNYYPYKTYPYSGASSSVEAEAAAVQMAIWHFADGVDPGTISYVNSGTITALKERANSIISDANAHAGDIVPSATLIMNAVNPNVPGGQVAQFQVSAYNELARPAANIVITLTTTSGTLSTTTVSTDATGKTPVFTLTQGASLTATVTASAAVTIPQGTRYYHSSHPNDYQKLVLATPVIANRTSTASVRWSEKVNVSVQKTVSNSSPKNGDNISYTITCSNSGPGNATGVTVSELLPGGITFISATPSVGSFDATNGVWTVGNLNNGSSASLTLNVKVEVSATFSVTLGAAAPYNLFLLEDLNQPSSDTEGKVAVGRDCNLANYSIGYTLPNSNGTEDVLVVGRNLVFQTGDVFGGNVVYGNIGLVPQTVGVPNGTVRKANIIDFDAAGNFLRNLSTQVGAYAVNGQYSKSGVTITLTGNDPYVNVFKVPGSQLSTAQEVYINAPNGAVVIVNIDSTYVKWGGNLVVNGTSMTNCIYNFYKATTITIQGIDVTGSILAPLADVNFITGVQNGQMIAKSVTGQGQFNNKPFIGNLPLDTTIVNIAQVLAVTQVNTNANVPVNAPIHVSNTFHTGNGTQGTGNTGGTWSSLGGFGSGEVVWTTCQEPNGNLLTGTLGGKIYRSTDGGHTFSHINQGMSSSYIWSLKCNSQGHIYAGTENGLHKTTNGGTTWTATSLPVADVRCLQIDKDSESKVYAGTWGSGVYKSTNHGSDWTQINNGLTITAVHSLTMNSKGDLLCGTFGGGVYKMKHNESSWVKSTGTSNHIWSLGCGDDDELYAGSYGNGASSSSDDGESWHSDNSGLSSSYIYGVTCIDSSEVFLSGYNGGVYRKSHDKGGGWQSIGLEGFGVSSITFDKATGKLYAGTSSGKMYVNASPTSIGKEKNTLPKEFSLADNYPNPFNPSTIVEFSVPSKQLVSINVYNVLGQLVCTLVNREYEPGKYQVSFDASKLTSGIYFYRLNAGSVSITKKMVLTK